ncbi:MAG: M20/M25/M40 family metallo-hydrolase [bacterium]
MTLFELAKKLIDIPSVSGDEAAVGDFLSAHLKGLGFQVREQRVRENRVNVLAETGARPKVILCTHMDTVPPFLDASEDEKNIYGRGACDAKGIMAAMIAAAESLLRAGATDFGLLFLVGEETDSLGAQTSNSLNISSDYIIVGEPTENKLAVGHKGLTSMKLTARGRSAHSALPELGDSAIEKLLDVLNRIRETNFGEDPLLGNATLNIGAINGGLAHNVIADRATATLSVRNTVACENVVTKISSLAGEDIQLEILLKSEPQKLLALPDFEHIVVPYGTDIPHLRNFGKPLLIGPGSITVAHTRDEYISKKQLSEAVDIYMNLVITLMGV